MFDSPSIPKNTCSVLAVGYAREDDKKAVVCSAVSSDAKHRTGCRHRLLAGGFAALDEIAELIDVSDHLGVKRFEDSNGLVTARLGKFRFAATSSGLLCRLLRLLRHDGFSVFCCSDCQRARKRNGMVARSAEPSIAEAMHRL